MDWKIFATTFATVFLAELGDKTQLATFGIASGSQARLTVFLGSALALVASSAIAVIAGAALGKAIPAHWVLRVSGVAFIGLGVWTVWKSFGAAEG